MERNGEGETLVLHQVLSLLVTDSRQWWADSIAITMLYIDYIFVHCLLSITMEFVCSPCASMGLTGYYQGLVCKLYSTTGSICRVSSEERRYLKCEYP